MYWIALLALTLLGAFCRGQHETQDQNQPQPAHSVAKLPWDEAKLSEHLKVLTAEAHPMGSQRQSELAAYLKSQAEAIGLEVTAETFTVQVPDPTVTAASSMMQKSTLDLALTNVYAKLTVPERSCLILLSSHYDSKRLEGRVSLGANDSGSSSAALLEIMRSLASIKTELTCSIMAVWFDGEEAYLPEWGDGQTRHPAAQIDHLYGSRHLADQLTACQGKLCAPASWGSLELRAMIHLDMIGAEGVRLSRDTNSDSALMKKAVDLDKALYGGRLYGQSRSFPIEDDHLPFAERGLPTLDLINFENLSTWHTDQDTLSSLSLQSIKDVSQLAMALILDSP